MKIVQRRHGDAKISKSKMKDRWPTLECVLLVKKKGSISISKNLIADPKMK